MTTLLNITNGCFFTFAVVVRHRVSRAVCAAYGSQMSQTIALKMVEAFLATYLWCGEFCQVILYFMRYVALHATECANALQVRLAIE